MTDETPDLDARPVRDARAGPASMAAGDIDGFSADRFASELRQTIEGEMIPRLMLAHRLAHRRDDVEPNRNGGASVDVGLTEFSTEDIDAFLDAVLQPDPDASHAFVDERLIRGDDRETVICDLLGGAARRLGEMWEEDSRDLAEVTLGLCRLHEVLRRQSLRYEPLTDWRPPGGKILLATFCGDQHLFGCVMVAEFFRRAGWRVSCEPGAARDQLAATLGAESFDVLGLSACVGAETAEMADEIAALRAASRNAALRVIVGGRTFSDDPALVAAVGADGGAVRADCAPAVAHQLLASMKNQR